MMSLIKQKRKFWIKINLNEKIDKYVNLVRMTIDPDDEIEIEFDIQDDYQHIKIAALNRVLH